MAQYEDPVATALQEQNDQEEEIGGIGELGEINAPIPAWKSFVLSKWGCAFILSTFTILLMIFIRPAFLLKRKPNDVLTKPKINWVTVLILWVVLFIAIIAIPSFIAVCKKKWIKTQDEKQNNPNSPASPSPSPPSPSPASPSH